MGSFSLFHWAIVGLLAFIVYKAFKNSFGTTGKKSLYCKSCGSTGLPRIETKGHLLIELVLWLLPVIVGLIYSITLALFLILPGLIYSIWRITSRGNACAKCGSRELVPTDTPVAIQAASHHIS